MTNDELKKKRAAELAGLRSGDEVHVSGRGYRDPGDIGKVVKRTATQIVVELNGREFRFRAERGTELGTTKAREVSKATQAHHDAIEKGALLTFFNIQRSDFWEGLDVSQLRAMKAVCDGQQHVGQLLALLVRHLNAKKLELQVAVLPRDGMAESLETEARRSAGKGPKRYELNPWDVLVDIAEQLEGHGVPMTASAYDALGKLRQRDYMRDMEREAGESTRVD